MTILKFATGTVLSVVFFFVLVALTGCHDPVQDCVHAAMVANGPEAEQRDPAHGRDKLRSRAHLVCLEAASGKT